MGWDETSDTPVMICISNKISFDLKKVVNSAVNIYIHV